MLPSPQELEQAGLEVIDLAGDKDFARRGRPDHDSSAEMEGMHRLAAAFLERPETILQELVNVAVELCGADSAGISIERDDKTEKDYYRWIATAGVYSPFLDASLPRFPSACTVCLERGRPQLFRVNQRFFELIGTEAALVTDGILLPWLADEMRGTIFIIAHDRQEAFDGEDLRVMEMLAKFAAIGVRNHRQQSRLLTQASLAAAAAMASELAHEINNPLQVLANKLYLATQREGGEKELALSMQIEFDRLAELVNRLLELPIRRAQ